MTKGSEGYDQSTSKTAAMICYGSSVPAKTTGSGGGKGSYETKTTFSYGDKQSGSYGRETATDKVSVGDFYWKNGTTGTRSEYTQSSKVRVGDKRGYTEVHREERVRDVVYHKSGYSSKNYGGYGNKKDDDDGGSYGGCGKESDDGGSYGGFGNDYDDCGSDGGYDYDSYEYGSDGGYDYDSYEYGSDGYYFDY